MGRLQHKKGRKSSYVKELNSNDNQKKVRERVLLRDGFMCRECGSKLYLEAHHITYYINGQSIIGKELEGDNIKWVITLCSYNRCHENVHKNTNHKWNPKNTNKQSA